jgi:hypothetical protein
MLTLRRARSNVRLGRVPLPRRYATYRVITSSSLYRQTIHQHQQVSRLLTHQAVYPRYRSVGGGSGAASSARPPSKRAARPNLGRKDARSYPWSLHASCAMPLLWRPYTGSTLRRGSTFSPERDPLPHTRNCRSRTCTLEVPSTCNDQKVQDGVRASA